MAEVLEEGKARRVWGWEGGWAFQGMFLHGEDFRLQIIRGTLTCIVIHNTKVQNYVIVNTVNKP